MRNKTLALIRKSKKEYYNEAVKNGTSTKHIWKNLKMIANYDNDDEEIVLPSKLLVNNLVVDGKSNILNALNEHFTNIANIVDKMEFKDDTFSHLQAYLDNKLNNITFDISFITTF